jgi:5-methylcytosine-specific restriction endonuclease McrA
VWARHLAVRVRRPAAVVDDNRRRRGVLRGKHQRPNHSALQEMQAEQRLEPVEPTSLCNHCALAHLTGTENRGAI